MARSAPLLPEFPRVQEGWSRASIFFLQIWGSRRSWGAHLRCTMQTGGGCSPTLAYQGVNLDASPSGRALRRWGPACPSPVGPGEGALGIWGKPAASNRSERSERQNALRSRPPPPNVSSSSHGGAPWRAGSLHPTAWRARLPQSKALQSGGFHSCWGGVTPFFRAGTPFSRSYSS